MVISGRSRGGDARTHDLPLTGIYKGMFADFLLFILLIANSGNYLHISVVLHYKTVCNNLNSNY